MADMPDEMKSDIDEVLKEKNGHELPEAPASVTIKTWIDGYGVMITMRSEEVSDVIHKLEFVIDYAKSKGWKPSWKEEEAETKPSVLCPLCSSPMVKRTSTKGPFWGCTMYPKCRGIRQVEI